MKVYTHDTFVAYAGADRSAAEALVAALQARRVSVLWDHLLHAEESFDTAIPRAIASCRVLALLVSDKTWDGQHYASQELTLAIEGARKGDMMIVPVWLKPISIEKRPYGLASHIGIDLTTNNGCIGCVAGTIALVVLRAQLTEAVRRISDLPPTVEDGGNHE